MLNNLFVKKSLLFSAIGILGISVLSLFLYKMYIPRVNAFGCFDDCFNFMGGYFLLHNKHLYSQIFYNHAPGMAYISALIQLLTHPQNLYDVVLKHRQFVFIFGLVMNIFLFLRFGYSLLPMIFIYELTKFYVFGDRFLAEGIIVYPLLYLTGIALQKIRNQSLFLLDWILGGFFAWFVVFMREPFVPLTLCILGILVLGSKEWKRKGVALGIFFLLSLITLLFHNISEFYFNVVTTNSQVSLSSSGSESIVGIGAIKAFLYPIFIFFSGSKTFLKSIEIAVSIVFFFSIANIFWRRHWRVLFFVFLVLGLANFRFTPPGLQYYEAFHQAVWYALFLFITTQLVVFLPKRWMQVFVRACLYLIIGYILFSPQAFWKEKVSPYQEFIINYGRVLQAGDIVRTLSKPTDTLFVDGFDDMVYWVSHRYSSYQYSWYTSLMPAFPKYTSARIRMLQTNPPDLYYGSCLQGDIPQRLLTSSQQSSYVRLLESGKPSCIWVKKTKIPNITKDQWDKAKSGYYTLPENFSN